MAWCLVNHKDELTFSIRQSSDTILLLELSFIARNKGNTNFHLFVG
jgi:hypothetical protein